LCRHVHQGGADNRRACNRRKSTFAAGTIGCCWRASNDTAREIKKASFDTDCPHGPISNSVVRNKIPLASQTGQAFMVGNSNLAAGICPP